MTTTSTHETRTDTDTARDAERIRELVRERETSMRTGDAERIVARYAPDAVVFDLAPPLRHAGPELHDPAGLRAWFAEKGGSVGYEVRDLSVTVGGDVAFCYSLDRMYDPSPAATFTLWFRSTLCLRKVDGNWLVAHEHQSTPLLMDGSFGAAVDLEP